jgi:hypothetical protein
MSKDLIIRKPIFNLEAALAFAEARTPEVTPGSQGGANANSGAGEASGTDLQANRLPPGDRRSTIDFGAALAFAEARTVQQVAVGLPTGKADETGDSHQSAAMGRKRLTIEIDQWLNKQLGLIATAQGTTVDDIIGDLVRKHLAKNGPNVSSRGIKVRARDS